MMFRILAQWPDRDEGVPLGAAEAALIWGLCLAIWLGWSALCFLAGAWIF